MLNILKIISNFHLITYNRVKIAGSDVSRTCTEAVRTFTEATRTFTGDFRTFTEATRTFTGDFRTFTEATGTFSGDFRTFTEVTKTFIGVSETFTKAFRTFTETTGTFNGVTNDLTKRVSEHRTRAIPGSFTWKYNCTKLVYYNAFPFIAAAIAEEKRLKAGSRKKKIELIEKMNPGWKDLWEEVKDEYGDCFTAFAMTSTLAGDCFATLAIVDVT